MKFQKKATDPFYCLPDDILLSILSRLVDLKALCQCTLVSKRFAALIPQTRTVSLIIPSSREHTRKSYTSMFKLLVALRQALTVEEVRDVHNSSIQKLKLPNFLVKFTELETINLEYNDSSNTILSLFPKWKIKCSSIAMVECMLTLLPASIYKSTDEQTEQESSTGYTETHLNGNHVDDGLWPPMSCFTEWLCIICMLAKNHSLLKTVTISDAQERGKLIIRDEKLVKMRNPVLGEEIADYIELCNFHSAWIPVVKLPLSGFTMRGVLLVIINYARRGRDYKYDEIGSWDFSNDEMLLAEAIKEVLKNHRHEIFNHEV